MKYSFCARWKLVNKLRILEFPRSSLNLSTYRSISRENGRETFFVAHCHAIRTAIRNIGHRRSTIIMSIEYKWWIVGHGIGGTRLPCTWAAFSPRESRNRKENRPLWLKMEMGGKEDTQDKHDEHTMWQSLYKFNDATDRHRRYGFGNRTGFE